jgi:hypothetical protein
MTQSGGKSGPAEGLAPSPKDRRRHKRVMVALPGRCLLEDGSEQPCECIDISAGGLRLRAAKAGPWGSRVVVYLDGVGRVEGHLIRRAPDWFAIETRGSSRKEERVEERIAWIMQAEIGTSSERRRLSRQYVERQQVQLTGFDGARHAAELTDISREGAALLTEAVFETGARVRLDGRRARVVRAFPGGLALKFENWALDAPTRRDTSPPIRTGRPRRAGG